MKFYDQLENHGVDTVLERMSPARRQQKLQETADDELIYYFIIGLTAEECTSLWGSALQREMRRLSPEDTFTAMSYLDRHEIPSFFSRATLTHKISRLHSHLVRCCLDYEHQFRYLLDTKLVDANTIRAAARTLTLSQIAYIIRVRPLFRRVFQPVFDMAFHCLLPVKRGTCFRGGALETVKHSARRLGNDIRHIVMEFIVQK